MELVFWCLHGFSPGTPSSNWPGPRGKGDFIPQLQHKTNRHERCALLPSSGRVATLQHSGTIELKISNISNVIFHVFGQFMIVKERNDNYFSFILKESAISYVSNNKH